MRNGGYQVINFRDKNLSLNGSATTIKGIYEAIESSYRKPILATGITIDNVEKNDGFVIIEVDSANYTFMYGSVKFSITKADAVTVTKAVAGV